MTLRLQWVFHDPSPVVWGLRLWRPELASVWKVSLYIKSPSYHIELDLDREGKPFGPIRRQDASFRSLFVQGRGLNSESSLKCNSLRKSELIDSLVLLHSVQLYLLPSFVPQWAVMRCCVDCIGKHQRSWEIIGWSAVTEGGAYQTTESSTG